MTPGAAGKTILLMGPTAAGKTDAAIQLHEEFGCDIISVDSALVYRGMDIGTAKPDAATLRRAPHALIDVRDPWESYSASAFREDALGLMRESQAQGRVPLLAGGTMLYYRALLDGLSELPAADAKVRARLNAEGETLGWHAMHQRLQEIDPISAARIHPNDPQRIQRALEVYVISGRSLSDLFADKAHPPLADACLKVIISPRDRALLHRRIEQRFVQMLDSGFIEEVEALRADARIQADMPSMRSVGYRQVWAYLEGEYDRETLLAKGVAATRQLAKRQLTWLRKERGALWLDPTSADHLDDLRSRVAAFLD